MLYNYKECLEKFGSHYALVKAIKEKKIFKIKDGLYSNDQNPRALEIFVKEHKDFVFTLESAFYYLGISDVIPEKYNVATDKDASKYKDNSIRQIFMNNGLINIGVINIDYLGVILPIFNKERLLIELFRYKNKFGFDYYKEIINYYRNHINEINIPLVLEFLEHFPKKEMIKNAIQIEIL